MTVRIGIGQGTWDLADQHDIDQVRDAFSDGIATKEALWFELREGGELVINAGQVGVVTIVDLAQ